MNHFYKPVIDGIRGERPWTRPTVKIEQEECHQCGALHEPSIYVGRGRWFCSEAHFDEWMQWGRYERDER
jgi:hypothetical protein